MTFPRSKRSVVKEVKEDGIVGEDDIGGQGICWPKVVGAEVSGEGACGVEW